VAKACLCEAPATSFSVSSSDLMSKYLGERKMVIRELFNLARKKKPSIIFIDEIELIGESLREYCSEERSAFLELPLQMIDMSDDSNVFVLGATSYPWKLDPYIRRLFEKRIYVPLPESDDRLDMLMRGMKANRNSLEDQDLREVAEKTEGFSGSDMLVLIRDATLEPVRRLQKAEKFKKVNGKYMACKQWEEG
jgi:vacuolar protein-sorting-associated protein 4